MSAFYDILKQVDGMNLYRLVMQAKASVAGDNNLYDFWATNYMSMSVMKSALLLIRSLKNIQSELRNI